jgi:hypothetical protein
LDASTPRCSSTAAGSTAILTPEKRNPGAMAGVPDVQQAFGLMSEKLAVTVVATARTVAAVLTRTQPAAAAATAIAVCTGRFSRDRADGKRTKSDGNATTNAAATSTTPNNAAPTTETAHAAVTESPATATEATRTTTTEHTATAALCKLNALASRLTTDLR